MGTGPCPEDEDQLSLCHSKRVQDGAGGTKWGLHFLLIAPVPGSSIPCGRGVCALTQHSSVFGALRGFLWAASLKMSDKVVSLGTGRWGQGALYWWET